MSELKGQLLGMVLVLAAFGTILGILIPSFKKSAESVNKNITADPSGSVSFEAKRVTVEL